MKKALIALLTGTTLLAGSAFAQTAASAVGAAVNKVEATVANAVKPAAAPASATAAAPAAKATPAPAQTAPAAGGGAGKVWVNGKVYHCEGTKYYGKTKKGEYMTEAEAKAKGAHVVKGQVCSK